MPGEGGRKGRATGRQTQALPRQPRSPLPNGSRLTSPVRCSGRADPGIDPERHRNRRLDVEIEDRRRRLRAGPGQGAGHSRNPRGP
jgi:hypothetical protein